MKFICFCCGARFEPHCTSLVTGPYDFPALVLCAHAPVLTVCNTEQDRQCTCDINTETRSCKHCCTGKAISYVCSFCYPACNAHEPKCHLWPVRICNIFVHYLINGTIFENKVIEHKMRVLLLLVIRARSQGSGCTAAIRLNVHPVF
jgi:hypothetical protein